MHDYFHVSLSWIIALIYKNVKKNSENIQSTVISLVCMYISQLKNMNFTAKYDRQAANPHIWQAGLQHVKELKQLNDD